MIYSTYDDINNEDIIKLYFEDRFLGYYFVNSIISNWGDQNNSLINDTMILYHLDNEFKPDENKTLIIYKLDVRYKFKKIDKKEFIGVIFKYNDKILFVYDKNIDTVRYIFANRKDNQNDEEICLNKIKNEIKLSLNKDLLKNKYVYYNIKDDIYNKYYFYLINLDKNLFNIYFNRLSIPKEDLNIGISWAKFLNFDECYRFNNKIIPHIEKLKKIFLIK